MENEVLKGAAKELESQEKVKSEDVEAITEMADERLSVLAEYIGKLEEDAQEKITVKKDELFEEMD
ncbi:Uncharacterised protein [Mycobacteroides abscessus subsp. abscessus]|nr:Uncharacterised protein [Mycobacteroides abscessus subsp. abscessus]